MGFWTNISTGKDNATHDIGRVGAIASMVVGLGLQIYSVVWQGAAFSMATFGAGVAALATGVGAMLYLKKDTEPEGK